MLVTHSLCLTLQGLLDGEMQEMEQAELWSGRCLRQGLRLGVSYPQCPKAVSGLLHIPSFPTPPELTLFQVPEVPDYSLLPFRAQLKSPLL